MTFINDLRPVPDAGLCRRSMALFPQSSMTNTLAVTPWQSHWPRRRDNQVRLWRRSPAEQGHRARGIAAAT